MTLARPIPAALAALTLLATPAAAQDQPMTYTIHGTDVSVTLDVQQRAGMLYDQCQFEAARPGPDAFICVGYITGARDAMQVIWAANFLPPAFCVPTGTPRSATLDAFLAYMQANPDKRDLPGGLVVLQALREAFPCEAAE